MHHAIRILAAVAVTMTVPTLAVARPTSKPFVAPGLWQVVSDVQGPMNQRSRVTQEECWDAQSESGNWSRVLPGSSHPGQFNVSHTTVNTSNRSTVHLHDTVQLPDGVMTQEITMVFSRTSSALHRATMTGKGTMTFSSAPTLKETFTQHGHWIAASCPSTLPPATTRTVRQPNLPAL